MCVDSCQKLLNPDFTSLIENYDILFFRKQKRMNLISYYCQKITVLEQNIEQNSKKVGWDHYCF